jgi:hypothetical protein
LLFHISSSTEEFLFPAKSILGQYLPRAQAMSIQFAAFASFFRRTFANARALGLSDTSANETTLDAAVR